MARSLPAPLTIRRAGIDDVDALLPLVAAYREFYHQRRDASREREFIEGHLRRGTSVVFVAQSPDTIVGFAQMFTTHSTVHLGPSLIFEDLYVAPPARGAGVANALLAAAVAYAREMGAVGMFLETAMDNVAAQRVYERAGWRREGRFFKYNAPLTGD
jgi:ribosomal protein S18 acetylase RimI-like enzyme